MKMMTFFTMNENVSDDMMTVKMGRVIRVHSDIVKQ